MAFVNTRIKDEPEKSEYVIGFPKALNTIQDKSLVDNRNLTTAQNVVLKVDGVSRRPGSSKPFDDGGASYVYGLSPFYKKTDGTRRLVRMANSKLQYLNGSVWTDIGTTTYSNTPTEFVQARDQLFVYNGTDKLTYYDGSSITVYTQISTPSNVAVTQQGTTGSTEYSYRISAFNETGETTASTAVSISNGNETLDTTNYVEVTWDAVTGASGYNVYGRTSTGYGEVYLTTVYTNSYKDTGADTLTTTKLPPEGNTTGGIIAKGGIFTLSRQFVYGVTEGGTYYPTRLYYSGTLDFVDSFVGGEFGGGWVDIYSNDGGEIVDIEPFQDGVLVWKTNGLFKFYFTSSGLPALKEITRSHGGVSGRGAQKTENDIIYVGQKDNRLAVMTVGQQENYVGDQLRTNEVSIFISDQLENANRSKLSNIATWNYKDTFGFTYTTSGNTENDRGYVLDIRFGGWVYWTGDPMRCTIYETYDDGTSVKLYGGSNHDGYVIELFKNDKNDNGSAFTSIVGTKFYNGKMFDVDKVWRNPSLWFKYINGGASLDIETWVDGNQQIGTVSITTSSAGAGVGADLAGGFMAGTMSSSFTVATEQADVPVEIQLVKISRSLGFYIIDRNINTDWLFMGLHLLYTPLYGKPSDGVQKVNLT
ncbi:MAG: DUF1093 domain-containing protein [Bacteroidetes bacterium]|nr:MAG: DUF1093 domain-containing protein [Bacteroidota bacterium]